MAEIPKQNKIILIELWNLPECKSFYTSAATDASDKYRVCHSAICWAMGMQTMTFFAKRSVSPQVVLWEDALLKERA